MPLKLVRARKNGDGPWYIRGTVRGRRIEESTGTRERKRAEEFRARREAELLDEAIHGRAAVATFAHAAAAYLEFGGEGRFLTPILGHFRTTSLAKIDQSAVEACAKALYPGAKPSTIARQVYTPVSAVLQYGASRGMCEAKTLKRPRQPAGKTRWMTVDEAGQLVGACSAHLRPVVLMMLYTGARLSEALYLDWRQVNLDAGMVVYLDTKNGESRGVPLHPTIVNALSRADDRTGAVFRRPDGKPYDKQSGQGGQIKTAFRAATRRAGLGLMVDDRWTTDITPHTCRHTWATWHYMAHRDLRLLMELGGWKQISMVQRYTHVNMTHHAPSIAALPSLGAIWGTDAADVEKGTQLERLIG